MDKIKPHVELPMDKEHSDGNIGYGIGKIETKVTICSFVEKVVFLRIDGRNWPQV